MTNPKAADISNTVRKAVFIRLATEWDMIMLDEQLTRYQKDALNLAPSEIVVVVEEDYIIGFGILEKVLDDTGCRRVTKNERRHGNNAFIVRHLLEFAPMKTIYVASGKSGHFRKIGYSKKKVPQKLKNDSDNLCGWGKNCFHQSPQAKKGDMMIRGMK